MQIKLPMNLRYESLADDKNMISLFYGPILLCGSLDSIQATKLVKNKTAPSLIPSNLSFNNWFSAGNKPLTFKTNICRDENIELMPFYNKTSGESTIFWKLRTENEQNEFELKLAQKQKEIFFLDSISIDKVMVNDSLGEIKHNITGKNQRLIGNDARIERNILCRKAFSEPFGYDLKVD